MNEREHNDKGANWLIVPVVITDVGVPPIIRTQYHPAAKAEVFLQPDGVGRLADIAAVS